MATDDGEEPIDSLQVGTQVWAFDPNSGTTGTYPVTAVLKHTDPLIEDVTIDGEQIQTTPEHPFYTEEEGWVAAGQLWPGAHVRQEDGLYGTVERLTFVLHPQTMYNLTVARAHTFFVGSGRWLVHNECKRFGGGQPSSEGQDYVDMARGIHRQLSWWERQSTVVAVTEVDSQLYVTVNGGAAKSGIPTIERLAKEMGAEFIPNPLGTGSHAERYLNEYFGGVDMIGISRVKGPCPACQEYFKGLQVELDY